MKTKKQIHQGLAGRSSQWLGACNIAICFLAAGQSMAQNVWSGANSANWNNAGNWSLGLPVDNQALTFNGTPPQTVVGPPDVATVNNDLTGLTTGNLLFGNGGPNATAPNNSSVRYTLTGNSIFLNGNINNNASIQAGGGVGLITITDIIDLNISLKANSTWTLSNNGAGATGVQHGLVVNGLISETGGSFGIQKNNSGALTLANVGNSFTGPLTVTNGNTTVTGRLDVSGQASSIGAGSVVNLSGGILAFNHSAAPASPWTFNRDINLTASTTLQNTNTAGPFTINGVFNHTGGNKTLLLGGSSAVNLATIQSTLADSITPGVLTISKGDTGTWGLSGPNTFTGQVQINNGSLIVQTVGDSGSSSIGVGMAGLRLGNAASTGGLVISGSGGTTARQVQIGNSTGTGGAGIGSNGSSVVTFSAPNFNNQIDYTSGTIASNRTLFLNGTSTATNEITGAIRDNLVTLPATGTANVGLTKQDAGRWILAGANLYTGTTTVSGGVLQLNNAAALPAGGFLNLAGGVLGLGAGDFTRALGTAGGEVSIGGNGGFAAYGNNRIVNIGGSGAVVNWNGTAPSISGNTLVLGSSTATHTVTFENPLAVSGGRFLQTNNGAASVDGMITGNITGTGFVSKTGAGTLQLNGTGNAWTVGTFIDSGTLRLGAAGVLPDSLGLTVKRAGNAGNTDGKLDLAGNDETIGNLTLGSPSGEGNALSAGQNPAVVSSGSAATLTIPGNLIYDAGNAGFLNGQATISANIVRSGNPFITVGDGAAADDLVISGKISGSFAFLTKDGSGTLVLSGTNDYDPTAATNVNAGTLLINGNSSAVTDPFNVNGTSILGGNGSVGGNVNVGATGNLSPGATGAVGTFSILGNLDMSGQAGGTGKLVYSLDTIAASDKVAVTGTLNIGTDVLNFSDFTFSDLPGLQNGTYKLITSSGLTGGSSLDPTLGSLTGTIGASSAQGTLQLTGGDLELVVTGAPSSDPFEDWAGLGVNFEDDANNDGVENGLAWLLGASGPNVSALGKLPTVTQTAGSLKLTFDMLPAAARDGAQLFIEHSSNLGISDPWSAGVLVPDATGGSAPVTFVVSDSDLVDPENPLDVEATISSTEAAAGKLFGRVRAER